jgi:hypothetical protein
MTGSGGRPKRVRLRDVEWLMETLSDRDWAIIETVCRVWLASGIQLERLHFSELTGRSRSVARWRVLKRLVDSRVLVPPERRVGTSRHGSAGLCYELDSAGQKLVIMRANQEGPVERGRMRRQRSLGEHSIAHTLDVTELYVTLVERARSGEFVLEEFQTEAAAYWPNGLGGRMKPDAFIKVRSRTATDYWWFEADRATESLPVIRAKLVTYLDFLHRGQLGPDGVVPRVLVGVPTAKRQDAVQSVINRLAEPANAMFLVACTSDVVNLMAAELMKD